MKLFRSQSRCFASFSFILLFLVTSEWCRESQARGSRLQATVVISDLDCSQENCDRIAECQNSEQYSTVIWEMLGGPVEDAMVTAESRWTTREAITDASGIAVFDDLPQGVYDVSAKILDSTSEQGRVLMQSAIKKVRVVETNGFAYLPLYHELISVSGRITDASGNPIAAAKVTGTAVPVREVGLIDSIKTISDADGYYKLEGFAPVNYKRFAGYLNGGSLNSVDSLYTQAEIRVEAEGFQQRREDIPRIPLITESRLEPARRFHRAWRVFAATMARMAEAEGEKIDLPQMKDRLLPASKGNAILGVDIVLESQ